MRPNASCKHVDDERDVDEAAPGRDIREVGDPELIRTGGHELAVDEVHGALLHESSLARTMPTDRILTGRCDTTLVGRERSSDSRSHSRGWTSSERWIRCPACPRLGR